MSSSNNNTRKRKHHQRPSNRRYYRGNPSRGGPGILLTCETSREIKCEREGREILNFYYDEEIRKSIAGDKDDRRSDTADNKRLTLEQELDVLQRQKPNDTPGHFQLFDTGCPGTVFFMYSSETSNNNGTKDSSTRQEGSESVDGTESKRVRTTTDEKESATEMKGVSKDYTFDPVRMVRHVLNDIASDTASSAESPPASRFVTRMIPLQVTCFATLTDLEMVLFKLLETYKKKITTQTTSDTNTNEPSETFRINIKKRQCNQIKSLAFIETAATLVIKETGWKVQLIDPDHIIWIEICKNLMGVSILGHDDVKLAKKFNLAALRDEQQHTKEDGGDDDDDDQEDRN